MEKENTKPERLRLASRGAVIGIFTLLFVYALSWGRPVLVPIVMGIFLSMLLAPAVRWMRRKLRIPAPLGAVLALGTVLFAIGYGSVALVGPASDWGVKVQTQWPEIEKRMARFKEPLEKLQAATRQVDRATSLAGSNKDKPPAQETSSSSGSTLATLLDGGSDVLFTSLVAIFLALFLLQSVDSFLAKLVKVLPRFAQQKRAVTISRQVEEQLSKYLFSITAINVALGASVGLAVGLAGLPNPVLWGALAATLNFIPYIGALLGIVIILAVSLLTFDDTARLLLPPLLYAGLNGLESYVITPMVVGRRVSLSPAVVFISVVFLGWLWGAAGAFLAVPIAISTKILFLNIESLSPLGVMLSDGDGSSSDDSNAAR